VSSESIILRVVVVNHSLYYQLVSSTVQGVNIQCITIWSRQQHLI